MSATKYQIIDVQSLKLLLEEAYNYPTSQGEADEKTAYRNCHAKLRSTLDSFGKYGGFGVGDFLMDDDWKSHWIRIYLTSEKLIRPEFIPAIQRELKKFNVAYSVLVDREIEKGKTTFILFIENEKVMGFCKWPEILHSLGFPRNIN